MSGRPPPPSRGNSVDDEFLHVPGGFQFDRPRRTAPPPAPPPPPPPAPPAEPVDVPESPISPDELDPSTQPPIRTAPEPQTISSVYAGPVIEEEDDEDEGQLNPELQDTLPQMPSTKIENEIQELEDAPEPDGNESTSITGPEPTSSEHLGLSETGATFDAPEVAIPPTDSPDLELVARNEFLETHSPMGVSELEVEPEIHTFNQPLEPEYAEVPNVSKINIVASDPPNITFPTITSPSSETSTVHQLEDIVPEPAVRVPTPEPPVPSEIEPGIDLISAPGSENGPTIIPFPTRPSTPVRTETPVRSATPVLAEPTTIIRAVTPVVRPVTPIFRPATPGSRPATPGSRPRTPAIRLQPPVIVLPDQPNAGEDQPAPGSSSNEEQVPPRTTTPAPIPLRISSRQPSPIPEPIREPETRANNAATAFAESGNIEAANEAIETYKRMLEEVQRNPNQEIPIEKKAEIVTKLSNVLSDRFEHFGDVDNIEEAVDSQLQIAELAAQTSDPVLRAELQAESLKGLGKTMALQFEHTGDPEDAEAAVKNLSKALDTVPQDSPARPVILGDIAKAQLARYIHMESEADLNQALASCQQAIEALPVDSPARAPLSSTYGKALLARFENTNNTADINEAVEHLEAAIVSTPATSPERPKRLRTYGDALIARFKDQKDANDVQAAIETQHQALTLLNDDSAAVPEVQGSLAAAYQIRYRELGRNTADLDAAIDYFKQAVEETPFSSPEHARVTGLLAKAFMSKYRLEPDFELLSYAVMLHQQALAQTPSTSRHRFERLDNLGYAFSKRYRSCHYHHKHRDPKDRTEALKSFNEALQHINHNQNHPRYAFLRSEINRLG